MPIHWKPFLAPSTLALKFAIKTLLAGGLALWCAFRFDLEQPQWALMTVLIVSQPLSGMVVAKGLFRLLGTLVGTAMSVLMIALFAQAPGCSCWPSRSGWGSARRPRPPCATTFPMPSYFPAIR